MCVNLMRRLIYQLSLSYNARSYLIGNFCQQNKMKDFIVITGNVCKHFHINFRTVLNCLLLSYFTIRSFSEEIAEFSEIFMWRSVFMYIYKGAFFCFFYWAVFWCYFMSYKTLHCYHKVPEMARFMIPCSFVSKHDK